MSSAGLPVSRLINVDVVLSPLAAQAPNLNSALIVTSDDAIDVEERIRRFETLEEVAALFGTNVPVYEAAALFFSQVPQPNLLFIGRWAEEDTPGLLETGVISAANLLPDAWTPINSGNFFVYLDGIPRAVAALNFGAVANINAVAAVITAALNAIIAGSTCVYDAIEGRFVITSGTDGVGSEVSYLDAPTAVGNVLFGGQPAAANTLTLNGTALTYVAGAPAANEVQIGGTIPETMTNLAAVINASADVQVAKFEAVSDGVSRVYLKAKAAGVGGNALTLARVGANMTLSGATMAGATGTDVSGMMEGLSTDGGNVVEGIDAETPVEAMVALNDQRQYFYMVTFSDELTNQEFLDVAAFLEGTDNKHVFGVTSTDPNCRSAQSTTDIMFLLKAAGYNRSWAQYSANDQAVASWLGRAVTVNFAGNNTVLTMMYQGEPGVVPENLTSSQAAAIKAKNGNVFAAYNNGTAILQNGQMASGVYFDDIQNTDWLAYTIQNNIFNTLYQAKTKVPQTDPGNKRIATAIEAALIQGVNNGTIAPGQWNAPGFGQLVEGDYLDKGYYIFQPPSADQNQADREARKSVLFQVAVKLAGAIHTVDVIINVNR